MQRSYLLTAAIGLTLLGTSARAADPLPDSLSLGGVTLYGTIDIGYAYQSHGVPSNGQSPGGLEYQAFTTTRNFAGSVSTFASSGLEQTKIGVRVQEPIVSDWSLVGRVETGINPLSAELTDGCASVASNSALKQGQQTANIDSSRCGQFFNSQAFGGMSNPQFGQLTIGRHNSLMLDALLQYDPQSLSLAFSYFGYSGTVAGAGTTEAARWDNSGRYFWQNPNFRVGVMYSTGGADTGILGKSYGGQLGVTFAGLSVDAVYENEKGAVNLRSAFDNGGVNPLTTSAGLSATGQPLPPPGLAAYISDDTSWNIMAKYTFEFGSAGPKDKLTLYAGYAHLQKAHGDYTSGSAQGDYAIDVGINVNNSAEYNVEWAGARYAFASGLNLVASFIHIDQNSWTINVINGPQDLGCSAAGLLCAGDFWESAFVVDYIFNKHYDLYAGVNYSEVTDGLANGFPGTTVGTSGSQNQTTFMVGGRVKF